MIATLAAAAERMQGELHGEDRAFQGVSIDTRTIGKDELFFALQGPNFDGRDYVDVALRSGAAGAVVTRRTTDALPQIEVDDTKAVVVVGRST